MKVRVLAGFVAVAMLAGVGSASAQTTMSFGAKGGPNFSNLSDNPAGTGAIIDNKTKVGVTLGGFVIVPVNEMVAFQPEFLYQQLGSKIKDLKPVEPVDTTISLDYIEIPLLGRFGRSSDERAFYFLAGPTIGFNLSAKRKPEGGSEVDIKDPSPAAGPGVSGTSFGLSFGVGMTIKKFLVEYRYTMGLTGVFQNAAGLDYPDAGDPANDPKSGSSAILVGYHFGQR